MFSPLSLLIIQLSSHYLDSTNIAPILMKDYNQVMSMVASTILSNQCENV